MIALATHRLRQRRHYGKPFLAAIRWAVWLGANTPARLSLVREIPRDRAAEQLRRAELAGVLVRIGSIPSRTRLSPVYATPDPQEFP